MNGTTPTYIGPESQGVSTSFPAVFALRQYYQGMTAARDELRRLVEQLPDDQVSAALAEVQRLRVPSAATTWPPPWFGAIATDRTDISASIDEALADGFGR